MSKLISCLLLFLFLSGTIIIAVNSALASKIVEDSWNAKAPIPMALEYSDLHSGLDTVVVDGKIYAMGGSSFGVGGINRCYDPVIDKWSILETHPNQNARVSIFAFQDKIYCIDSIVPSREMEVYDIATDSWSVRSAISGLVGYIWKVHVMDDKVFILTTPWLLLQSSYNADEWYNRCVVRLFVYDPVNDYCIEKASIPFPQHYGESCASVVVDGKVMVFGSFFTGTSLAFDNDEQVYKGWVYDLNVDVWSEVKLSAPDGVSILVGATTGLYAPQKIYFFQSVQKDDTAPYDGMYHDYGYPCTYVYDPLNNSWSTAQPMLTPYGVYSVAVVDDVIYVIGEGRTLIGSGSTQREYFNMQYVPMGYQDTLQSTGNTLPLEGLIPQNWSSNSWIIIISIVLTAGVAATGLVWFRLQKKKNPQINLSHNLVVNSE